MKKIIIAIAAIAAAQFGPGDPAYAVTLASAGNYLGTTARALVADVKDYGRFTPLAGINAGYFLNAQEGKSEVLVDHNFYWYRFLSADVGFASEFDAKAVGTVLGGASVHVDKILAGLFPEYADALKHAIPAPADGFYNKLFVGYATGWNVHTGAFVHGVKAGLKFSF